jgi:hypothetical protein
MRNSVVIICLIFSFFSCNNNIIEKPKNLIEKDKMINILYDLSLLDAVKTQFIEGGISNQKANDYIYKKYKIDSLQLVQSNKYYASDIEEYKKMFEEVKSKLDKENNKLANPTPNSIKPIDEKPRVE